MGDRGTIDLIEVLQAATNVALDLDARPLPKFITLPRRRRRRRRPDAAAGAAGASGATAGTAANANAEPASGAAAAVEEPDRMGDMLAEEQVSFVERILATRSGSAANPTFPLQREYSTATSASAV